MARKIHKVKAPDKASKKEFTSDRSWGGKNILTGEPAGIVQPKCPFPDGTMGRNWKTAGFETHWNEAEQRQEGVCFRDGKEIARFIVRPDRKKRSEG